MLEGTERTNVVRNPLLGYTENSPIQCIKKFGLALRLLGECHEPISIGAICDDHEFLISITSSRLCLDYQTLVLDPPSMQI